MKFKVPDFITVCNISQNSSVRECMLVSYITLIYSYLFVFYDFS